MRWGLVAPIGILACAAVGAEIKLPQGAGKPIVQSHCSSCHGLDVVAGKPFDEAKWGQVVGAMNEKMAAKGAALSKVETITVTDYLARSWGPDRGRKLVEDICSLCHEWDRVMDYERTKEQWAGTIKGMISEGAPVTEEEFDSIVEYLAKNFGPEQ